MLAWSDPEWSVDVTEGLELTPKVIDAMVCW